MNSSDGYGALILSISCTIKKNLMIFCRIVLSIFPIHPIFFSHAFINFSSCPIPYLPSIYFHAVLKCPRPILFSFRCQHFCCAFNHVIVIATRNKMADSRRGGNERVWFLFSSSQSVYCKLIWIEIQRNINVEEPVSIECLEDANCRLENAIDTLQLLVNEVSTVKNQSFQISRQ